MEASQMSSYLQLATQIKKLQKEADIARKREIAETIANIRQAIELFGLTAHDLGFGRMDKVTKGPAQKAGRKAKPKTEKKHRVKSPALDGRSVVAAKYRDSATGATWTGRGKQPKWLSAAIQSGKKLRDFRI